VSLPEFVAGLDIEGIGELVAEKAVAAGFDTLDKLRAASPEDLVKAASKGKAGAKQRETAENGKSMASDVDEKVGGFGEILAQTLVKGLQALAPEIDALLASGAVRIRPPTVGGVLSGKSFCFTGELASMKRAEAGNRVKALGGQVKNGVTKDLVFLVTNDPESGSEKNRKARELGVSVIGEEEFLALIGGET